MFSRNTRLVLMFLVLVTDSYQLDNSVTDVDRGNLAEYVARSSNTGYKPEPCRTTTCPRDENGLSRSGYPGSRSGTSGRPQVDRAARKYSPYQTGKYRNPNSCVPLCCDRNACNIQTSNLSMNSRSCRLSSIHQNDVIYGGSCGPKVQKPCSVARQELKEIPYSCNYSYAQKPLTQCSLNSIGCNISKLPFSNTVYPYDYPAFTGYTGYTSDYSAQNNAYQLHKENFLPNPTLMV